jgi:predicted DNA-binding transcriptional regulator AlpA
LLAFFYFNYLQGEKEMEEKRFINENEVASITGLSVQTLRNWRFQGKGIPYIKAGRSVRYQYQDVIAYMEERRIIPRA